MKNVNTLNIMISVLKLLAEEVLVDSEEVIPALAALLTGINEANTTQLNINHQLGVAALQPAANHSARRRDKNEETEDT